MGKTIYQTNVIMAKEKDSFESQLNHFLSTLDTDDFVEVQYQENSGIFSALVLSRLSDEDTDRASYIAIFVT